MRILGILGKLLISVGVGVLLFVVWTLKGTDLYTNAQQDRLEREFVAAPSIPIAIGRGDDRGFFGPDDSFTPGPGDPVFKMRIPKIDVTEMVVQGVGTEELRMGPGHYPSCRSGFDRPLCTRWEEVWPGERGRVVVSGHRTTYGAPFWGIDKLRAGDEIEIEAKWGNFTYTVTGSEVVRPDATNIVIEEIDKAELILTTCNPRFSAAERLIVYAELEEAERA